ncbi:hypothetical protein QYE76_009277 [Lolium multiflorum]|uniref:BTB domain-containing protein n=1 Tax=Lolium multiflorum TaxID=4521 RepID=A0AAD8TUZ8_LOLMU|nr:hypothetical protein QYE76_009277 [Lolium multiflorum]
MDKGLAHKGKKDVEKKWPIPDAARAGADLCYASSPSAIGYAVATPAKKKRMYETEAQVAYRECVRGFIGGAGPFISHSIPLYYACLAGHDDAVRMLLAAGAVYDDSTFEGERCYRAALNLGIRRILCHYESRPRPLRPLPLAPFHAALRSAFLACPANRVGADSTPTLATDAAGELWPSPPDITLYVQGRPIEAHRVILAARSPYFRRKLATEWRNRKEVTFSSSQSLSFKLMHILVVFFYSDRCEVAAEDLEDFARICKACKCTGMVKRLTAHKKRRDTLTRELGRDYSQKPFVLQGRSMDHRAADSLPSGLRRISATAS